MEPRFCCLWFDMANKIFKRQVDPLDDSTEAVEFCHKHSEHVRLIVKVNPTPHWIGQFF